MIFTITGRIPSKKNSRKAIYVKGRTIMIANENYDTWHEFAAFELKGQMNALRIKNWGIGKAFVVCTLYPPDKIKGDLTNKMESLMDLMVDVGLLNDDNWYEVPMVLPIFGGIDKAAPRAEIKITSFDTIFPKVAKIVKAIV